MVKFHTVSLDEAERLLLTQTACDPHAPNRRSTRARILLVTDQSEEGPGWTDTVIAEAFAVSVPTVARLRERAAREGIGTALEERRHRTSPGTMDGEKEARLTALACRKPPEGQERWTLRLLAAEFGKQEGGAEVSAEVSYETVRRTLKKTDCPRT